MPIISNDIPSTTLRLLLSGLGHSGKTTSLQTFIYGDYDYWDDAEHELAVQHAQGKSMAILLCPGEFGQDRLPPNTEHLKSFYHTLKEGDNTNDVKWSIESLHEHEYLLSEVFKAKPTVLAVDGIHKLWGHMMNRTTSGEWFAGLDMSFNAAGNVDKYRPATFHNRTHTAFINYISKLNTCQVPVVVATVLEELESGQSDRPSTEIPSLGDRRYFWPALPGKMSKEIGSNFAARLSCQIKQRCFYGKECDEYNTDHYVWQFLNADDVRGVGIKKLNPKKITKAMKAAPYIHQSYEALKQLIDLYK